MNIETTIKSFKIKGTFNKVLSEHYEKPGFERSNTDYLALETGGSNGISYTRFLDYRCPMKMVWFHPNNKIRCVEYYENQRSIYLDTNVYHSIDDNPAVIHFDEDGNKTLEVWYNKGKLHRLYKPAILKYDSNGTIIQENWFLNDKNIMEMHVDFVRGCEVPHWLTWTDEHTLLWRMYFIDHINDKGE